MWCVDLMLVMECSLYGLGNAEVHVSTVDMDMAGLSKSMVHTRSSMFGSGVC
jgi:hypothetical protein